MFSQQNGTCWPTWYFTASGDWLEELNYQKNTNDFFIFRLSKSTRPPAPRTSARTLHSVWTFDHLKVSASSSRLLTRSFQFQKETSSSILCDTWQTGSRRPDPPEMAQHLSSPIRCSSWRSCGQTPSLARMPTRISSFTITKNCQSCWEVLMTPVSPIFHTLATVRIGLKTQLE